MAASSSSVVQERKYAVGEPAGSAARRVSQFKRPASSALFGGVPKRAKGKGSSRSARNNIVSALRQRQDGTLTRQHFREATNGTQFRGLALQDRLGIMGDADHSKIVEVVACRSLIFTLSQSGMCCVLTHQDRALEVGQLKVLGSLNAPGEFVRSMFVNKLNGSLITVSVLPVDNYSVLHSHTTSFESLARGEKDTQRIFTTEVVKWPGYVEFDSVNGAAVTFNAEEKSFSLWDLRDYSRKHRMVDKNLSEVKVCCGLLLMIFNRQRGHVTVGVMDIETATRLRTRVFPLKRGKAVEFVEQFNEALLLKQKDGDLMIYDMSKDRTTIVSKTKFRAPHACVFLHEHLLFLAFRERTLSVWSLKGERIHRMEGLCISGPSNYKNSVVVTAQEDTVVALCQSPGTHEQFVGIASLLTGELLATIDVEHAESLSGMTCVCYNDVQNEVYIGNDRGELIVWAKGYPRGRVAPWPVP